jgi:hypothetical protein
MCTVVRDFQIILTDDGGRGKISYDQGLDENNRIYIPENGVAQLRTFYEVNTPTGLAAYSELLENENAFSFTTYDSSTNENIKVGVLTLTNHTSIIRDSPYQITVRGKDGNFGSDVNYLFYTKDLYPQVITSIKHEKITINVFPNPVSDFLTISLPENQFAKIDLFDISGKGHISTSITGTDTIDLRSYPTGVYFFRVLSGNIIKVIKLIKR